MRWLLCLVLTTSSAQTIFETKCAPCHGSDGAGGERGPSLVRPRLPQNLRDIIRNGVPGGGMPGFALNESEMNEVMAFIRTLNAPAIERPPAGDVSSGERIYHQQCATCHRIGVGPDLSNIGRERRLSQIEQAVKNHWIAEYDGLKGVLRNNSSFDAQLMSLDGRLHRIDLSKVRRESSYELMDPPANTKDLLAYLARLDGSKRLAEPQPYPTSFTASDWPTYNGNPNGNRHSALKQINTSNVATLAPTWMFPLRNQSRLEVTPVVVGGIMYVTAANEVYALDAKSGRQIWHYCRPQTKGVIGDASAGINRGVAIHNEKLFLVTDHAHLLAIHRISGQLLWEIEVADYKQHYGLTSAPLVVNDLVVTGTSGGDEGARGLIAAFRVSNGELAWKHYTVPVVGEPGSETWKGRAIEHGCGAPWFTGSFDGSTLFWTTGNPCPDYNGDERKGDNLWTDSVLALDPATGQRKWHFQFTPHDLHDWDAVQPVLAVDTTWQGKQRKLILQANRNGFFYVLDRENGEFLLAEKFVKKLTWATKVGEDGRPVLIPSAEPSLQGTKACPAVEGATNWMSTAFSPQTGLFYVQTLEKCTIYSKSAAPWEPGKSYYGGGTRNVPGERGAKILRAIHVQTGKIAWELPQEGRAESWGGVLSTDGGLVFFGEDSGAFEAVEAKTGKPLWHFQTNTNWKASPMTYEVDGKQFVSVAAGGTILAFALP